MCSIFYFFCDRLALDVFGVLNDLNSPSPDHNKHIEHGIYLLLINILFVFLGVIFFVLYCAIIDFFIIICL